MQKKWSTGCVTFQNQNQTNKIKTANTMRKTPRLDLTLSVPRASSGPRPSRKMDTSISSLSSHCPWGHADHHGSAQLWSLCLIPLGSLPLPLVSPYLAVLFLFVCFISSTLKRTSQNIIGFAVKILWTRFKNHKAKIQKLPPNTLLLGDAEFHKISKSHAEFSSFSPTSCGRLPIKSWWLSAQDGCQLPSVPCLLVLVH